MVSEKQGKTNKEGIEPTEEYQTPQKNNDLSSALYQSGNL